jgi:hypothetical protein
MTVTRLRQIQDPRNSPGSATAVTLNTSTLHDIVYILRETAINNTMYPAVAQRISLKLVQDLA